jgi:hypothetical protein
MPSPTASFSVKRLLTGGLSIFVLFAAGLVAAGFYFDATGGGPSALLMFLLWGGFLLGVASTSWGLFRWAKGA